MDIKSRRRSPVVDEIINEESEQSSALTNRGITIGRPNTERNQAKVLQIVLSYCSEQLLQFAAPAVQ